LQSDCELDLFGSYFLVNYLAIFVYVNNLAVILCVNYLAVFFG